MWYYYLFQCRRVEEPEQSDGREVLDRAFGLALSLLLALGHRRRYPTNP